MALNSFQSPVILANRDTLGIGDTDCKLQVLRWSALALGVVYGFSRQSSITARDKVAAAQAEFDRKAGLISQAKQEWARQHPGDSSKSTRFGGGFFFFFASLRRRMPRQALLTLHPENQLNGNDKDFDIETYLHLKD